MTPLLPAHAMPFFGPTVVGSWGGVPWDGAALVSVSGLPLVQRPLKNTLAIFARAGGGIIATGTVDDDADGPNGSLAIDPCWQPDTSLRWPGGHSLDSRVFRGMVMHRIMERHGAGLGDLGMSAWGGTIHCHQNYDLGPTKKFQEGSEAYLRLFGVIEAGQSSRHAATVGNDVQDFCSLIFPGSAPKDVHGNPYAVEQDEMIARTLALWRAFTGRPPVTT